MKKRKKVKEIIPKYEPPKRIFSTQLDVRKGRYLFIKKPEKRHGGYPQMVNHLEGIRKLKEAGVPICKPILIYDKNKSKQRVDAYTQKKIKVFQWEDLLNESYLSQYIDIQKKLADSHLWFADIIELGINKGKLEVIDPGLLFSAKTVSKNNILKNRLNNLLVNIQINNKPYFKEVSIKINKILKKKGIKIKVKGLK